MTLFVVGIGSVASAQEEPSEVELELARGLYADGLAAMQEERWEDARSAFSRVYQLIGHEPALFNLAGSELALGQLVESLAHYEAYLRLPAAEGTEAYREAARAALVDLRARLAHLTIEPHGAVDGDAVQLDGVELNESALWVPIPVNPGTRHVTARRGDDLIFDRELVLAEGQRDTVELEFPVPERAEDLLGGADTPEPEPEPSSSVFESPWFWVITLGLLAAGATVTALFLLAPEADPFVGNAGQVIIEM